MEYLDTAGIRRAFAAHLIQYRGYTDEEADVAVSDFPDGQLPYLFSDYIGECKIEGEPYYMDASHTSLWLVGLDDVPDFCFYTYYRVADIPNHTGAEYAAARKLYQTEDLDPDDFPGNEEQE